MAFAEPASRLKVFISYSRADLAFADELYAGLEVMGFEPSLDRHAIAEGEDWKARLGALIAEAETVVFVISPDSARSEVCAWEVEEAARLSKRIVPVLWRAPGPHAVPARLAALNYVRFDPGDDGKPRSFMAGLRGLDRALKADLEWLRDMARYLLRAQEWDRGGRPANRLLSGSDIAEIKGWAARRPPTAPDLTALHLDFIRASEGEEASRAATAAADLAERERLVAEAEAAAAAREAAGMETARQQRRAARLLWGVLALVIVIFGGALWQAHETEKRELLIYTSLAATAMAEDRHDRAMRYALQAFPAPGSLPWAPTSSELEGRLQGAAMLTRLKARLKGHGHTVASVELSPDGKRVLTASWDDTARLWDAANGRELATLKGHEDSLNIARFSPDGGLIVTASDDKTARIWDARTGQALHVLKGHEGGVLAAAFSADGSLLLTGSADGSARLWETRTGSQVAVLDHAKQRVALMSFSPDGQRAVTVAADSVVRAWDVGKAEVIASAKGEPLANAAISRDGRFVALASWARVAQIFDAGTGKLLHSLKHGDVVSTAGFTSDAKLLATGAPDGIIRVWEVESGRELAVLRGHSGEPTALRFSEDGRTLASAAVDTTVRLWEIETWAELAVLRGHDQHIPALSFSPDNRYLVSASRDATALIWRVSDGEIASLRGHTEMVRSAVFGPGNDIASAGFNETVRYWRRSSGQASSAGAPAWAEADALILADGPPVSSVALDSSGRLALVTAGNLARLWDVKAGGDVAIYVGHEGGLVGAAFSPDGKRIVTTSADKTARIWRTLEDAEPIKLEGHEAMLFTAVFSPDGARVVTSSMDATARIWDASSGKELTVLRGHKHWVTSAMFTWNGERVITTAADSSIAAWDGRTGASLGQLRGHQGPVMTAAFTPDARRLVTSSRDGTVRVWDTLSGSAVVTLTAHRGGALSARLSEDGRLMVTGGVDKLVKVWDVSWLSVYGATLRERVCAEKLTGAQEFTDEEVANPILSAVAAGDATARNPCLRRGPLSLEYWTRLPGRWWRSLRGAQAG